MLRVCFPVTPGHVCLLLIDIFGADAQLRVDDAALPATTLPAAPVANLLDFVGRRGFCHVWQ